LHGIFLSGFLPGRGDSPVLQPEDYEDMHVVGDPGPVISENLQLTTRTFLKKTGNLAGRFLKSSITFGKFFKKVQ
jgi:hypothetical protein